MRSDINKWILSTSIPIVQSYGGNITVRQLHYRLVDAGMTNDMKHYKKVVNVMTQARWNGEIPMDGFVDRERATIGQTRYEVQNLDDSISMAKRQIKSWARTGHSLNRWENQSYYPEVFIEKKALQGVFESPCQSAGVALNPCKGYPSITFLKDAAGRFRNAIANDKEAIILYFGDYDPSGEDIPRSIQDNLERMGVSVQVKRILLMKDQVLKWKLPIAPTKMPDSRSKTWEGIGQVELDSVEPKKLEKICADTIDKYFNDDQYAELTEREEDEKEKFKRAIKKDFKSLLD